MYKNVINVFEGDLGDFYSKFGILPPINVEFKVHRMVFAILDISSFHV